MRRGHRPRACRGACRAMPRQGRHPGIQLDGHVRREQERQKLPPVQGVFRRSPLSQWLANAMRLLTGPSPASPLFETDLDADLKRPLAFILQSIIFMGASSLLIHARNQSSGSLYLPPPPSSPDRFNQLTDRSSNQAIKQSTNRQKLTDSTFLIQRSISRGRLGLYAAAAQPLAMLRSIPPQTQISTSRH